VVRENSGGIYTGVVGVTQKGTPLEVATQVMQCTRPVVERYVKYAYEYTRKRNSKKMLTLGLSRARHNPPFRRIVSAHTTTRLGFLDA
jgi:isocitrate/isopropylmalate dehydrogenase